MNLKSINVFSRSESKLVKKVMKQSFSKDNRFPVWFLNILSKKKNITFRSYHGENKFIGFSYEIEYQNMVFILYMAVIKEERSKGYGSSILEDIKERHNNKQLVILSNDINKLKENDNPTRKYLFFVKNGFMETGYYLKDEKKYRILSTDSDFDKHKFSMLLKDFSFDFYNPKIKKIV